MSVLLFDLTPFHKPVTVPTGPGILEELETCLSAAVPAVGVAARAVKLLEERWHGQQPTIPKTGTSDFVRDAGFFVALAAVERGFQAAEAFIMSAVASNAIKTRFEASQIYIPFARDLQLEYEARLNDIRAYGLVEAARRHAVSYQAMRHLQQRSIAARRVARKVS